MQFKRKHKPYFIFLYLIVLVSLTACNVKKYTMPMPQVKLKGKSIGYGPVFEIPITLSDFKIEKIEDKVIYTVTWLKCQPECRYMFRLLHVGNRMALTDSVFVEEENGYSKGRIAASYSLVSSPSTRYPNKKIKLKLVCNKKTQFTLDTCSIVILLPNASFLNRP